MVDARRGQVMTGEENRDRSGDAQTMMKTGDDQTMMKTGDDQVMIR